MNINERLTAAARAGAYGRTGTAFPQLDSSLQQRVINYVLQNQVLTEEIVRTALNAAGDEEIEELLKSVGSDDGAGRQRLHTGD